MNYAQTQFFTWINNANKSGVMNSWPPKSSENKHWPVKSAKDCLACDIKFGSFHGLYKPVITGNNQKYPPNKQKLEK